MNDKISGKISVFQIPSGCLNITWFLDTSKNMGFNSTKVVYGAQDEIALVPFKKPKAFHGYNTVSLF